MTAVQCGSMEKQEKTETCVWGRQESGSLRFWGRVDGKPLSWAAAAPAPAEAYGHYEKIAV